MSAETNEKKIFLSDRAQPCIEPFLPASLVEHEVHGQHQADEGGEVVPVQGLALEEDGGEEGENHQRDDLLDDLELHQREGTAVLDEADAVGRHLEGILT